MIRWAAGGRFPSFVLLDFQRSLRRLSVKADISEIHPVLPKPTTGERLSHDTAAGKLFRAITTRRFTRSNVIAVWPASSAT